LLKRLEYNPRLDYIYRIEALGFLTGGDFTMTKIDIIGGNVAYFTVGNAFVDYTSAFMRFIPSRPVSITRLKWVAKKAKALGYNSKITIAAQSRQLTGDNHGL